MQPVHGTLWEPWEALLYLEYSSTVESHGGPSELCWRKGGLGQSRGRAEAQETAGNTADGVQRKPEVTTKSHSGARSYLLMPQNPLRANFIKNIPDMGGLR